MSDPTTSDFSSQVRTLGNVAREICRSITDNQTRLRDLDAMGHTQFLGQWAKNYEEYRRALEASESAVSKLAAAIKFYVSLQEYLNDQTAIDELIEELGALSKRLQGISFNQEDDFVALRLSFEDLGRQIDATVNSRCSGLRGEREGAQIEVSKLEQDLKGAQEKTGREQDDVRRANETARGILNQLGWGRTTNPADGGTSQVNAGRDAKTMASQAMNRLMAGGRTHHEREIRDRLEHAQAKLRSLDAELQGYGRIEPQVILDAVQSIQKNLQLQPGLLRSIFSEVTRKLSTEVENLLNALRAVKVNPSSPETQLALRNARQRVNSASGTWKERAKLLLDEYSQKMK